MWRHLQRPAVGALRELFRSILVPCPSARSSTSFGGSFCAPSRWSPGSFSVWVRVHSDRPSAEVRATSTSSGCLQLSFYRWVLAHYGLPHFKERSAATMSISLTSCLGWLPPLLSSRSIRHPLSG